MRETQELLIKTPTRLLVASKCTGRILLAVITAMVIFTFVAIVQEAQAEITEVRVAATDGWSNHRNRNVFYNGSRFFLLYHNNNEIYYKSSSDNITWSAEALLVSGASYFDFDIYLIDDTKFDLVYRTTFNSIYVRTYTISCAELTTAGNSALIVSGWCPQEIFVGRSGSDRIYVVGRFNGYVRIYSADQTGDAENVTSWTLEKELKNTGATNMTMLPYQNEDKILMVYSMDDGVYARVAWYGGRAGNEYGPHQAGSSPAISSPVRISDTDFRVIIGPTSGNNAYMEEWKFNGSAWSYVATVDSSENDKYNPSLFYDRLSGDMYVFCFDLSGPDIIRHYKPSGGSWGAEVDVDGTFTPSTSPYPYPITQMHEPPPASGRTVPRELVWAFRVPNATNKDLIVGNLRLASPPAPSVAGYSCYRTIRVDSDKISGTDPLTDFPLLVKFENDPNLVTGTCAWVKSTDGWDIIFTDDSDTPTVQYDHEIEKFDGTAGTLFAWVRIPSLSATADTDIRMWYGKSGATDTSNPTDVWDCDYRGVWHLKETPGADAYAYDSTCNDHDLTFGSGVTSGDQVDGRIGGAIDFDDAGSTDRLTMGDDPSFGNMYGLTVETWVNLLPLPPQTGDNSQSYFLSYKEHADSPYFSWQFMAPSWDPYFYLEVNTTNSDYGSCGSNTNPSAETWYHVVGVYEHDQPLKIYVNGVNDTAWSSGSGPTGNVMDSDSTYSLGWNVNGILDEFRVSAIARSAEWIEAEYKNVNDSDFYSVTYESCGVPREDPNTLTCSRVIRINHTKVSDLDGVSYYENFPMLVKFAGDEVLRLDPCGEIHYSDGSDIMFTDSTGAVLDHEIEEYDGNSGSLVAWVKIPKLYTGSDTDITMHYGKETLQCATDNPTGVWDDDYVGVWHLHETSGTHADSTSNNNTGTPSGGVNQNGTGQIDGADVFGGSSGKVEAPDYDILNAITVSAWINWDGDTSTTDGIVSKRTSSEVLGNWDLRRYDDSRLEWLLWDGTDSSQKLKSNSAISSGELKYVVVTFDDPTNTAKMYIDGAFSSSDTSFTNSLADTPQPICIGWGGQSSQYFGGIIDEVRISSTVRTAGWIETEFNNQSNPGSFYSTISDTCGSGEPGGDYSYCKKITIPRGNVTAPSSPGYLANFPLLVKITNNNDLKNGVTHAEGWDIIFLADDCTVLDHEVESYDAGTGTLVAWVKIPQLNGPDADSDTVIYMKYGDADIACPTADPAGLWDSYKGVWHLNDTSGDTQDSTSYNTNGSLSGTITRGATGQINNAFNFGTNGEVDWGDPSDGHLDFGTGEMTLSLWVNMDNHRHEWEQIIWKGKESYQAGYQIEVDDNNYIFYFTINEQSGGSQWGISAEIPFTLDTWMYIVGVVDRTNNRIRGYKDGGQVDTSDISSIGSIDVQDALLIGEDDWGWPDARIEEVRLSNVARSAEWIKTEYDNQNNPESFITLGSCLNQTIPMVDQWEEKF